MKTDWKLICLNIRLGHFWRGIKCNFGVESREMTRQAFLRVSPKHASQSDRFLYSRENPANARTSSLSAMHMQTTQRVAWEQVKNGGPVGDRTPGLRIANAALSQLSYWPKDVKIIADDAGACQNHAHRGGFNARRLSPVHAVMLCLPKPGPVPTACCWAAIFTEGVLP